MDRKWHPRTKDSHEKNKQLIILLHSQFISLERVLKYFSEIAVFHLPFFKLYSIYIEQLDGLNMKLNINNFMKFGKFNQECSMFSV